MYFVGSLVFGAIVIVGILLIAATRSQHADELSRLAKHQRKLSERQPLQDQQSIFLQQGRDDYLAKMLSQAGLEAKYDAIKQQWIMTAIFSGIAFCGLAFVVAKDFFILGLIFGTAIGAAGFIKYLQIKARRRQNKMTEQLPAVLESMCSSLKAGSPITETFKVLSETAPEPIRSEFKRGLVALQLGKSFRECINEMCTRIRTDDFKLLAQAIFISQDVGANLADVVATIAEAIRERFKLRDYLNSLTAQGKATAVFIGILPYGITAMTYVMTPGYIMPFFMHPIARLIFIAMILWEFVGFWILMKLTTFEV